MPVIPFSEAMRPGGLRRRHRPERLKWNAAAAAFADPMRDAPIHGFTDRPYLAYYPEREIADVYSIGRHLHASCPACGIDVFVGALINSRPRELAHRHNAERHPRRWARSQHLADQVALNEARRVTTWGADA